MNQILQKLCSSRTLYKLQKEEKNLIKLQALGVPSGVESCRLQPAYYFATFRESCRAENEFAAPSRIISRVEIG